MLFTTMYYAAILVEYFFIFWTPWNTQLHIIPDIKLNLIEESVFTTLGNLAKL